MSVWSSCRSLIVFFQSWQETATELWLWRRLATPRSCSAILQWWSVWQKASRSPWCPGAGKVKVGNTLLCCLAPRFIRDEVSFSTCSINKESAHTWWEDDRSALTGWLEESERTSLRPKVKIQHFYYIFRGHNQMVCWCSNVTETSLYIHPLWSQIECTANQTATSVFVCFSGNWRLDGTFTLSDQMGSPFPLMWLSSQPTWWFGTRGVTTLEFTCVEPTSRRPENLSPLLLSCTCLVGDKLCNRNPLLSVNIKCNYFLCVTIFEKDHSSRNEGIYNIVLIF